MGQSDSKLSQYRDHIFRLADSFPTPLYSPSVSAQEIIHYYNDPNSWVRKDFTDPFSSNFDAFVVLDAEARDIYSVVSSQELRFICRSNATNFTNFVRFIAFKIHVLSCLLQNCDTVALFRSRECQLLTCIRILTKIMPVFFEMDHDQALEDSVYWNQNSSQVLQCDERTSAGVTKLNVNHVLTEAQDLVPLGVLLLQACVKLLFIKGFTAPLTKPGIQDLGKASFLLWENGINTSETTYTPPNPRMDSKRLEVLRLLVTLSSKQLYSQHMPKFLAVLTTSIPEFHSICLTSSMVNLVCRSCRGNEDDNGLQYPSNSYHSSSKSAHMRSLRKALVANAVHLLNLSLICPIEGKQKTEIQDFLYSLNLYSTNFKINNLVSSYLSTLIREFDLRFVLINLVTLLKRPMEQAIAIESNPFSLLSNSAGGMNNAKRSTQARSTTIKSSSNTGTLPRLPRSTLQIIVLLWELMKCNRAFENYVADKYANKLILICIYYVKNYSESPECHMTLIPVACGFATYLSSKKLVLSKMQYCFNANYYANKIPNSFKISVGDVDRLTYRDFAIIQLSSMATIQVKENIVLNPTLIEIIFNLLSIPQDSREEDLVQLSSDKSNKVTGISYTASVAVLRLIAKMTSEEYLTSFADESITKDSPETSQEALEPSKKSEKTKRSYIFSPGFKLDMLALLLQAFNNCIFSNYKGCKHMLFVFCRHENVINHLITTLADISQKISYDYDSSERGNIKKPKTLHADDYFDDCMPSDIRYNWQHEGVNAGSNEDLDLVEKIQLQSLMFFEPERRKTEQVESIAELIARGSPNKTIELFEYADNDHDPILESTEVMLALRPERPVGLTFRKKLKLRKEVKLDVSWLGAEPLTLVMKIIQIVNHQFPAIPNVNGANYLPLLRDIIKFESTLKKQISSSMPHQSQILGHKNSPLSVNWDSREVAAHWYLSVVWSDIFNFNSVPFISTYAKENSQQETGQQANHQSLSQPQTPKLERWNSQGSSLSRTNSNSSSITTFFLHQEPDSAPNSAPNSPSVGSGFPAWANNKHHHSGSQSSDRSSLFRFSWTGFQKPQQEKIDEEAEAVVNGNPPSQSGSFVLDPGLLKPNAWVGTLITLFDVKVDERENYSLVDMTSNFLRKLRFGSNTNLNAPEGIMVTAGTLTPATSRPWTPRGSFAGSGPIPSSRSTK
ncbi:LANO_0G12904g1_1 [Lachancea nothofagi CBS 11611]|uniref:LANO_0G12904g1_1 n=1 Tax=Lachancea nothofagi CBS 11611 TaxID=1266666 RepID=A0A1G4KJV2_9SACH|nr:LANO_0G12904g1_1 [Lachancea nothofagi CBS 11611]